MLQKSKMRLISMYPRHRLRLPHQPRWLWPKRSSPMVSLVTSALRRFNNLSNPGSHQMRAFRKQIPIILARTLFSKRGLSTSFSWIRYLFCFKHQKDPISVTTSYVQNPFTNETLEIYRILSGMDDNSLKNCLRA